MILPPFVSLEDRFPEWHTARAIFEAFPVTPLSFFIEGDSLVTDTRWTDRLVASCPPEDMAALETLLDSLRPFLSEAVGRVHPEDFLGSMGSDALVCRINEQVGQCERYQQVIGEPTWSEVANHLLGVKPRYLTGIKVVAHLAPGFTP